MATFWLAFSDLQASTYKRFLGVVIMDLPEDATVIDAVRRAWKLGINPGGTCVMSEIERDIPAEHKNRLITDDALLISLGSKGRVMPH
jgi:hypothetical protein